MTDPSPPGPKPPAGARPRAPLGPDDFPASGRHALGAVGQRAVARVLDSVLLALPVAALTVPYLSIDDGQVVLEELPAWLLVVQVALAVAYEGAFVSRWGATLGKLALGLRVARYSDGGKPTPWQAVQRVMLPQVAAAIPVSFSGALVAGIYCTALVDPLRRGVHDHAAGTIVVRTR